MGRYYNFSIPGQEGTDPILIFTRRHIISFLVPILMVIIFFALPFVMMFFVFLTNVDIGITAKRILILVMGPYYLLVATYFFTEWISYYYNLMIVTPRTLIDVEQKTIFSRDISYVHLLQVEDISCRVRGILPSIFNYGDIIIQTAGSEEHAIIKNVPKAQETAAYISSIHKEIIEKEKPKV